MSDILIKQEAFELTSRDAFQNRMYPGVSVVTWAKLPFLPWVLLRIEPLKESKR